MRSSRCIPASRCQRLPYRPTADLDVVAALAVLIAAGPACGATQMKDVDDLQFGSSHAAIEVVEHLPGERSYPCGGQSSIWYSCHVRWTRALSTSTVAWSEIDDYGRRS